MVPLDALLASLELEPVADGRFRAPNADAGHGVIFGGQLLAQSIVAALGGDDTKSVKTLHTVFARSGAPDAPVEIEVDELHSGRAFASRTVTFSQGERRIARSMVLLTAEEPDFIRHADAAPSVAGPDDSPSPEEGSIEGLAWELRVVDGVDLVDPDAVGPADLDVWVRFPDAPPDARTGQALLAFATDGFLIGTAMRPHPGVGQAQAHRSVSTGVISHTLTFHEAVVATEWMLLAHHSPYAGHGRSYGQANVFDADGALVASYVQDGMIRPLTGGTGPARL